MNAKQIAERLLRLRGLPRLTNQDVDALTEAADLLERMAWVPVSERLPDDGQLVFARYSGVYENRPVMYWVDAKGNGHFGSTSDPDGCGSQPATHWMPQPDPPSE